MRLADRHLRIRYLKKVRFWVLGILDACIGRFVSRYFPALFLDRRACGVLLGRRFSWRVGAIHIPGFL
jgi:hypothetical protein